MPDAGRSHQVVSLLLLILCGGLCAIVDTCARSSLVANLLDDRAAKQYEQQDRAFIRTRNYGDYFETLLLDEVPNTDYSRGGAYVMGSSAVVFCAEFGDLPTRERKLIHNFAFPYANPTDICRFARFLVDDHGWLRAGGDKTAVLIGLRSSDMHANTASLETGGLLSVYLNGSGLFEDDENRIDEAPMSAMERAVKLRRNRWRSFLHRLERVFQSAVHRKPDPAVLRHDSQTANSEEESAEGQAQWAELDRCLDYLQSRGVRVTLMIMPTGSWYKGSVGDEEFMKRLPPLASGRQIPIIDCSNLLTDDEFMDGNHETLAGAKKVHAMFLGWAAKQLSETGALSKDLAQ